jgi:hypothetical protein
LLAKKYIWKNHKAKYHKQNQEEYTIKIEKVMAALILLHVCEQWTLSRAGKRENRNG